MFDKSATLEKLENEYWGPPEYNSRLVIRCHELRKIKLKDFSTEDLRMMIGQNFSLEYLIPTALEILDKNLFAEGDCYPGDLLGNVLKSKIDWNKHADLKKQLEEILVKNNFFEELKRIYTEAGDERNELKDYFLEAYNKFKENKI